MNATQSTETIVPKRISAARLYTIRDAAGKIVALIRAQSPSGALSYHAATTLSVSRTTADEAIIATAAGIAVTDTESC